MEEIEIKLRVPQKALSGLRRSPLIAEYRTARAGSQHLISTYFDTEALDLRAAKAALRIRRMGRALEQTVKTPKSAEGGLQSRTEWNAFIETEEPQLNLIEDARFQKWLKKKGGVDALRPIFTTDIKRTAWPVVFGRTKFEIALDQGEVRAGDATEPLSEVELELIDGDPLEMVGFALMLAEKHGLAVDKDSKAARGYRLFKGETARPIRAHEPSLTRDMLATDAFAACMMSGIEQLLANAPVARLGEEPEGIHQARIGVRRMRAALSVFKSLLPPADLEQMRSDLRRLQQELGPARDFDVFIEETLAPILQRAGGEVDFSSLARCAKQGRDHAYARARLVLENGALTRAVLGVEAALLRLSRQTTPRSEPALKKFAAKVLDKRWKQVLKEAGANPAGLPDNDLHPLRIELKKLRYTAAFFHKVYEPRPTQQFVKTAAVLQDCLGGLNDALVQEELLATKPFDPLRKEAKGQAALDALAGWRAARVTDGLSGLRKAWKDLLSTKKFWR